MTSVLAPVAAAAYRNNNSDYYGAVELDLDGNIVWKFDSTQTDMEVARLKESSNGQNVRHEGFRPASVQRLDNGDTLMAGWRSAIWIDSDGSLKRREQHRLMNDVHEVQKTHKGTILVASTGMDTILEFDLKWDLINKWHMWQHVSGFYPTGYYPDKMTRTDCRDIAFSPDKRYHLNYATYIGDNTIMASALNYGVFFIDWETGELINSFTKLDECHNPLKLSDQTVVCESGKDRIVSVSEGKVSDVLFSDSLSFPKDADHINDSGDFDIAGQAHWLITDTKNNRVVLWEEGNEKPDKEWKLSEDSKPYEADWLTGVDSNA